MPLRWLLIPLAAAVSACVPMLRETPLPQSLPDPAQKIQIRGADEAAIFRHLLAAPGDATADSARLRDWVRVEQAITGRALIAGNRVHLLQDGPQTFQAMFAAMRAARHHIHLETFIIDDDSVGAELASIAIEQRRAGVEVRMVYDAIGALNAEEAYFSRLRASGVELHNFHPLNPIANIRIWRVNNRHHRKIVVVDGRVGFIGGLNISGAYSSSSLSSERGVDQGWRDTQVQIEGPGVGELQETFARFWSQAMHAPPLSGKGYFPDLRPVGQDLIRVAQSTAGDTETTIYHVYLTAIRHARQRIWITQGYFSPDKRFLEALQEASRGGADVRLLLPGMTDSWITLYASRTHYDALLASGVRVFERQDAVQHAKTAVIDSVWSTIGSSNLDYRSFLHANEANIVVWGREFAGEMEATFLKDQAQTVEIELERWRRRAWGRNVLESFASLFDYWL
jgi:cardiolipin synthase